MLISQEYLKRLKKVNVSKDAEKTKERVQSDFKAATKEQRKSVLELSGQVGNSIYRIYKTGSVNARIVLALAQTFNIQPWYYTGEIDDRAQLDEGQLMQFLKVHGYDDLLKEINKTIKPKRPYNRKPKEEPIAKDATETDRIEQSNDVEASDDIGETVATVEVKLLFSDEPQMKKAVEELSEQEAAELLHTLFIRAKGGGDAAHIAEVVKRCLLK